jgi:glycosyltransferase involved in cell wall biosynthesis
LHGSRNPFIFELLIFVKKIVQFKGCSFAMNILFLTYQGDVAGSTNSIIYLCRGLARKGHLVYLGCRKESLTFQTLKDSEVKTIPMTFAGKFDRKNMRQIRDAVQKFNIQLINAQSSKDRYTSILARWIYRLPVKLVHTRRQISKSFGGFPQNQFYVRGTDRIVAVSHGVKDSLVKQGIRESHIEVIYNGTPAEKYHNLIPEETEQLRLKYNINDKDIVLGCVSRPKNQDQLLKSLNLLSRPITLFLIGIAQTEEYQQIINSYLLPHRILFIPLLSNRELLPYYGLFRINILASTMEGLSQSLLEAMALGVPVIATAAAGNLDLIEEGENGLLFKDGEVGELAKKIELLLQNEELCQKLIFTGKKTALENFSIERTVAHYEKLFQTLLQS